MARSALGRLLTILALIGMTAVLGYLAINVPAGTGFGNLPFVAIMVALTVAAVDRQRRPPDLVVARRDALRRRRADRPRRDRDARADRHGQGDPRGDRRRERSRLVRHDADGGGRRDVPPRPDRLGRVRDGRPDRVRSARPGPGRRRAVGAPSAAVTAAVRGLAPAGRPARAADRLDGGLAAGPAARDLRRVVPALGVHREPPDHRQLARRAHRPVIARPDGRDVRLPQRADRSARGLVAVVGLAVRPEARLVLPGEPGRQHDLGDLRRRATS